MLEPHDILLGNLPEHRRLRTDGLPHISASAVWPACHGLNHQKSSWRGAEPEPVQACTPLCMRRAGSALNGIRSHSQDLYLLAAPVGRHPARHHQQLGLRAQRGGDHPDPAGHPVRAGEP